MTSVAKSAICLLGPFSLLAMLLFGPNAIGTYVVGEGALRSPSMLLGGAILAMTVVELVLLFVDRVASSAGKPFAAVTAFVLPLVALALTLCSAFHVVQGALVQPLTLTLLCIAAICQIHYFTRLNALDAPSSFLSSAISFTAAILFICGVFAVLAMPSAGFAFLSLIMAGSGAFLLNDAFGFIAPAKPVREHSAETRDHLADFSAVHSDEASGYCVDEKRHVKDVVALALPLIVISVFCAFSLGQSRQEYLSELYDAYLEIPVITVMLFLVVVVAIFYKWKRQLTIDIFLVGMSIPLILTIAAMLFSYAYPNLLIASMLLLVQFLFFLYMWTSVLLIGRMISIGNTLTPGFVLLYLALYAVSMSLPAFEGFHVASSVIALVSLALLFYLLVYLASKSNQIPVSSENEVIEMGRALQRKCDEAAEAYCLSPRESELLPMLAIGLSSSAIAKRVILSDHTVKTHRYRIYQKLGIKSHEGLVEKLELVSPSSD